MTSQSVCGLSFVLMRSLASLLYNETVRKNRKRIIIRAISDVI